MATQELSIEEQLSEQLAMLGDDSLPEIAEQEAELNLKRELENVIRAELEASIDLVGNDSYQFEESMEYYLGKPNGKEVPGKSKIISTDVADAVEWIMPQVMKELTGNNEVVAFDPVSPEDEIQAKLETHFVQEQIMKYNDGFVSLHYAVKDALLHRNGALKCTYQTCNKARVQNFAGLSPDQFAILQQTPGHEVLDGQQDPMTGLISCKVKITAQKGKIDICAVPIEELRVANAHNNISLERCRFVAHVTKKTISDLVMEGFDEEMLEDLPEYDYYKNNLRIEIQDGYQLPVTNGENESMQELDIGECYLYYDINNDGVAEYIKVLVAGIDSDTYTILSIEELIHNPWVTFAAILMSHKFQGLSIYDRLKEIQDQKTSLLRSINDNVYLQNNGRFKVLDKMVNLDDLLISRAGGIVRVNRMDALEPIITPQLNPIVFELLNYLDEIRAGRVGVSAEGPASPQNIGDRVGSQGVDRLMTAKEELVGLIIRVIAETGIKPLCWKVRELARTYMVTEQHMKYRTQWAVLNPSQWQDRATVSVRVGAGTGNKQEQIGALAKIFEIQEKFASLQHPFVDENKIFHAIDEMCQMTGLVGAASFFNDPNTPPVQQRLQQFYQNKQQENQKQDAIMQAQLKSQMDIAQATVQAAQAEMMNVQLKAQLEQAKVEAKNTESILKAKLEQGKIEYENLKNTAAAFQKGEELRIRAKEADDRIALELTKLEQQAAQQRNQEFQQNRTTVEGSDG